MTGVCSNQFKRVVHSYKVFSFSPFFVSFFVSFFVLKNFFFAFYHAEQKRRKTKNFVIPREKWLSRLRIILLLRKPCIYSFSTSRFLPHNLSRLYAKSK